MIECAYDYCPLDQNMENMMENGNKDFLLYIYIFNTTSTKQNSAMEYAD